MGLLIPKDEVLRLHLKEGQQVVVDILKTENPLKELFGFSKGHNKSREKFLENRRMLESKMI